MTVQVARLKRRVPTHEVIHGHPGMPYHQTTTEDMTHGTHRFIVRPIPELPGQWRVDFYRSSFPAVALINGRPKSWLGRRLEKWGYL